MTKFKEKEYGKTPVITNIVASGRFPKDIPIEEVYEKVKFERSEYNPETNPALLVKVLVDRKRKHITLYRNGKYIITGATSEKELNKIDDKIIKILTKEGFLK